MFASGDRTSSLYIYRHRPSQACRGKINTYIIALVVKIKLWRFSKRFCTNEPKRQWCRVCNIIWDNIIIVVLTRDAPVDRPKIGTGRFLLIMRDRQPAGFCLFFGRFFRKCEHVICVEDIRQKHNTHRKTDTMKRTAVGVTLLAHK